MGNYIEVGADEAAIQNAVAAENAKNAAETKQKGITLFTFAILGTAAWFIFR